MINISAVVLTKNEEKNIDKCLSSLSWCDEVIIIDDFSEDNTIKKINNYEARRKNLHIYKRHLGDDFSSQRNFGLKKALGEWVLFVDADEIISEELASEIKTQIAKVKNKQINGFYIKRRDSLLGKQLKYGETGNIKLLRLGKKGKGEWRGKAHENWDIGGRVEQLKNPILHYPHKSISSFLEKINCYSTLIAKERKEKGQKVGAFEIICFPMGKFLHNFLIRLGFLDAVAGLVMAIMMSFHSFLVRAKLWLYQQNDKNL